MARYKPEVTDEQWGKIAPLLRQLSPGPQGVPQPRDVLAAPSKVGKGGRVGGGVAPVPAAAVDDRGVLGWDECFIDATFMPAKKGGLPSDPRAKGRERSAWGLQALAVYRFESTLRARRLARRLSPRRASELFASLDRDPVALARILHD